jgi:hypothetical protein
MDMAIAAVLLLASIALVVTSAGAADVTPALHGERPACAEKLAQTVPIKLSTPTGRMPVRGMQHFAAVYAQSMAPSDDATADAGDQPDALAPADKSRS